MSKNLEKPAAGKVGLFIHDRVIGSMLISYKAACTRMSSLYDIINARHLIQSVFFSTYSKT